MPKYVDGAGLSRFWDNIKDQIGNASQAQVDAWLNNHPEATTTVQPNTVTDNMLVQTGGVLDALNYTTPVDVKLFRDGQINNSGVIKAASSYNLYYFAAEAGKQYLCFNTIRFGYFGSNIAVEVASVDGRFYTGSSVNPISDTVYVVLQAAVSAVHSIEVYEISSPSVIDRINAVTEFTQTVVNGALTEGSFFQSNGATTSSSAWNYYTFDVSPSEKYTVSTVAGQSARAWLCVDGDGNVLGMSTYNGSPDSVMEQVVIPTNAAALIVNCNSAYTATIIKHGIAVSNDSFADNDKMYGKVLCAVGDSITFGDDMDRDGFVDDDQITFYRWAADYHAQYDGQWERQIDGIRKTWSYIIAKRHNMTLYNGGVNGSTMQGMDNRYGFSLANGRYTKLPDAIDYLIIWFGWNDTAYGTLGAITDTTNESFYGGYNVVLPYLIDKYPYAKIAIVVPYGTDANHREAVRLLGNKWGVAVWDNYQGGTPLYYGKEDSVGVEQSIVTANRAKYQALGAHPNHHGHKQLADMIECWMQSL